MSVSVTDVDNLDIPVAPDGSQGPAAGFESENGMCVYEFSVPLQDTSLGHYSLGAGAGTGLNLTVTAGPGAEMRRAMQETRSQGSPEGGGVGSGEPQGMDRRGGFSGGPGRGRPPGGHAEIAIPSVKVAVRLAAAP